MWRLSLIVLTPGLLLALMAWQPRFSRLRKIAQNLLVSYGFLALTFFAAELYFRYSFAQSENTFTWATRNWLDRYWETNSRGYRDREWTPTDWQGKQTVMLVGDSFTAGWGIEDPADRFGNVLADHLGDDYAVINIGEYGRSTPEELEMVQAHPLQDPDVIILQYFLNDISYAQLRLGLQLDPGQTPWWASRSAFLNFIYYRFFYLFNPDAEDWQEYDFAAYDNITIWEVHRQEIEAFIDHAEAVDARLIVVIFPNMLQPVRSIPYVDRVAQVFEERGHTDILKLFEQANAWALEDRLVSMRDTHPSVAFHHMVGETIYERFFADK